MCTRGMYVGSGNLVLTGRSMEWNEDMFSDAWVFPRGIFRKGADGPEAFSWKSLHGSVVISSYNAGTADGMNECGLVANMLYLAESDYGDRQDLPPLSIMVFAQYVLDSFENVDQAVAALRQGSFRLVAPVLPNGRPATCHLSISDSTGDSAIVEYLNGELTIHHGHQYRIMTNSPSYDQQLAINAYWEGVGGLVFLPGTYNAADRFARASFLMSCIPTEIDPYTITAVPDQSFEHQAVASVLGVMRSVGVPLGIRSPEQPNLASTLWRTVYDHSNRVVYFDSATSPNTFWIPFDDLQLSEGSPVKRLEISGGRIYAGNATAHFADTAPFEILST